MNLSKDQESILREIKSQQSAVPNEKRAYLSSLLETKLAQTIGEMRYEDDIQALKDVDLITEESAGVMDEADENQTTNIYYTLTDKGVFHASKKKNKTDLIWFI